MVAIASLEENEYRMKCLSKWGLIKTWAIVIVDFMFIKLICASKVIWISILS